MPTLQFPFGGVPWKHKMLSFMTTRHPGTTGPASLSVRRFFAAVARPKQKAVFREGLHRAPRNPRLLFGLWKCLEAQGRSLDAGWVQREFTASWRGGDPASSLHIEDF